MAAIQRHLFQDYWKGSEVLHINAAYNNFGLISRCQSYGVSDNWKTHCHVNTPLFTKPPRIWA